MTTQHEWGATPDGRALTVFTLSNDDGLRVTLTDLGATVLSIETPDSAGNLDDVTRGFPSCADAIAAPDGYLGSTIGRYANRIADAQFTLREETHTLTPNNGDHTLHGGSTGFHTQVWEASADSASVRFRLHSPAGHEGFPGNLNTTVTFTVLAAIGNVGGQLRIDYEAVTDQATPVNLTNHAYFNLAGHGAETIGEHLLRVHANEFVPVGSDGIPSGEPVAVSATAMDLRRPTLLSDRLEHGDGQLGQFGGFDHNYVLSTTQLEDTAAELLHPQSGRRLRVHTTKPGLQVYTANAMTGNPWPAHSCVALEAQFWPDSPNRPSYPSSILEPGATYRHTTTYAFDAAW